MSSITTGALVSSAYAFPFSKTKLLDTEPTRSTGERGDAVASSSVHFLGAKCLAAECKVTTGLKVTGIPTLTLCSRSWAYVDDLSPSHALMDPRLIFQRLCLSTCFEVQLSRSIKRPKLTTGHNPFNVVECLIGVVGLKLARANFMSGMSEPKLLPAFHR